MGRWKQRLGVMWAAVMNSFAFVSLLVFTQNDDSEARSYSEGEGYWNSRESQA